MPWVRRTRHLALSAGGDGAPEVVVRSLLADTEVTLPVAELEDLLGLPTGRWTWRTDERADAFARRGLLVSDEPGEPFERMRERDAALGEIGWHRAAAAFHGATRWRGVRGPVPAPDGTRPAPPPRPGRPLPPFPDRGGPRVPLCDGAHDSQLTRLLHARRTARTFDATRPLQADELAVLLRHVWGAHGVARLALGDVGVRKTSPSGGALHPVEVYPVVRHVEGLGAGVYHYLAAAHELELVRPLEPDAARGLVEQATAGQWYFARADAVFVLTARFGRSFWKYRNHAKAYRTLHLDAGHLSQTFYLLCTELGLGPFVTAAVDDGVLEEALGLDHLREGVLALCGCGRLPAAPGPLDGAFAALPSQVQRNAPSR